MTKIVIASLVIFISTSCLAFGQLKDSIGIVISKVKSPEKGNDLYEIYILNAKDTPNLYYVRALYQPFL
jgi:hypothetical protein